MQASLSRLIYILLLTLLLPFAPLRLLWRARRHPEYAHHWGERFALTLPDPGRAVWLHAVSLGEARAAAPLVRELRARHAGIAFLFTCMTPTGRAALAEIAAPSDALCYLPYDHPWLARRFLRAARPRLGLIMETELWPNLLAEARKRDVPAVLVNARLSERSARGYRRLGRLARDTFRALACATAQTESDAARLRALGASSVEVTGNLKFDVDPPALLLALGGVLRERIGARSAWLAASTREGEEALIVDAWFASPPSPPAPLPEGEGRDAALLVIVPRHPERFDAVAELLRARGIRFARRSDEARVDAQTQVLLGDSMGELYAYYAAADAAYVGGSLLPLGGQNLIEACAVGCPVLIGPHTFNFKDIADQAVAAGAALRVADAGELARQVGQLLHDAARRARMAEAGRAFSAAHRGATARVATRLSPWL
jgi:3-deoxy-D-manno-octulosonic-acid transferase